MGLKVSFTGWLVVFQSVKLLVADFLPLDGLGFGLLAGLGWLLDGSVACLGAIVGRFCLVVGDGAGERAGGAAHLRELRETEAGEWWEGAGWQGWFNGIWGEGMGVCEIKVWREI